VIIEESENSFGGRGGFIPDKFGDVKFQPTTDEDKSSESEKLPEVTAFYKPSFVADTVKNIPKM
jgi:hypothetical protein